MKKKRTSECTQANMVIGDSRRIESPKLSLHFQHFCTITFHRILGSELIGELWCRRPANEGTHTDDLHRELGTIVGAGSNVLDLAEGEHAVDHPAEHDVLPVEEVALGRRDEELAPIRVRAGVRLCKAIGMTVSL